jgi:hypothetical protein
VQHREHNSATPWSQQCNTMNTTVQHREHNSATPWTQQCNTVITTVQHCTSLSSSYHSCFVFGRSRAKISALMNVFVVFLSPSRQIPGQKLRLGHDCFLPNPFQLIIHYHPIIRRYIVCQVGGPPLVGCPWPLIQCIRSYPPYLEAAPSGTWGRAMTRQVTRLTYQRHITDEYITL